MSQDEATKGHTHERQRVNEQHILQGKHQKVLKSVSGEGWITDRYTESNQMIKSNKNTHKKQEKKQIPYQKTTHTIPTKTQKQTKKHPFSCRKKTRRG